MKDKLEKIIKELDENYDWYLERSEDSYYKDNWDFFEKRIHDLKIEINTYKKVLEMLGSDKE